MEEPQCNGCRAIIHEGNVVAFGEGIWHLDCFRCQKCNATVECDSNLVLLSNGNPVCENCSCRCAFCGKDIAGEVLMTGEDSYHADCFRCYRCGTRIENLVFAKNPQGICCIACHKERKESQRRRRDPRNAEGKCAEKKLPSLPPEALDDCTLRAVSAAATGEPYQRAHSAPAPGLESPFPSADSTTHRRSANAVLVPGQPAPRINSAQASVAVTGDTPTDTTSVPDSATQFPADPITAKGPHSAQESLWTNLPAAPSVVAEVSACSADACPVPDCAKAYPVGYVERLIDEHREAKGKLASTESKLIDAEANFQKIKAISCKLLEEFNRAKEDFSREVAARKQAEAIVEELRADVQRLSAMNSGKPDPPHHLPMVVEGGAAKRDNGRLQATVQELVEKEPLTQQANLSMGTEKNLDIETEADGGQAPEQAVDIAAKVDLLSQSYEAELGRIQVENDALIVEASRLRVANAEATIENERLTRVADDLRAMLDATLAAAVAAGSHKPSGARCGRAGSLMALENTSDLDLPPSTAVDPTPPVASAGNGATKVSNGTVPLREAPPKKLKWKGIGIIASVVKERDKEAPGGAILRTKSLSASEIGSLKSSNARRRPHQFQPHTFLLPLKCDFCNEKMWGIQLQTREMKCQACGCHAHAKCAPHVPPTCHGVEQHLGFPPDPVPVTANLSASYVDPNFRRPPNGIIGTPLMRQAEKEKLAVPLVVTSCVVAVEARGMEIEGIYRKSGPASMARAIIARFNAYDEGDGAPPDVLDSDQWPDITAVTSVLKQYFRELPEPLITFAAYDAILDAVRRTNGRELAERMRAILSQLPSAHLETLRFLMRHLESVTAHQARNLMPAKNVAVVFGPTLLRSREASNDASDTSAKNTAVEIMVLHRAEIFDSDAEAATAPHAMVRVSPRLGSTRNLSASDLSSVQSLDCQFSPAVRSQPDGCPGQDESRNSAAYGPSSTVQSRATSGWGSDSGFQPSP